MRNHKRYKCYRKPPGTLIGFDKLYQGNVTGPIGFWTAFEEKEVDTEDGKMFLISYNRSADSLAAPNSEPLILVGIGRVQNSEGKLEVGNQGLKYIIIRRSSGLEPTGDLPEM